MEEKIKEAFSDEEFVKSLLELETPEEVQAKLEEKDIDISIEEIKELREMLVRKEDGELDEDELENVAGGSKKHLLGLIPVGVAIIGLAAGVTQMYCSDNEKSW